MVTEVAVPVRRNFNNTVHGDSTFVTHSESFHYKFINYHYAGFVLLVLAATFSPNVLGNVLRHIWSLVQHLVLKVDGLFLSFLILFIGVSATVLNYFNLWYHKCKTINPCRFVGAVHHKPYKQK